MNTWVIVGTSIPRAATSVATRICTWPARNAIKRRLRKPWLRAPCNATAEKPSCCRSLARPSHSTWVLAKTMAWLIVVSRSQWSSILRLCWALSAQYSICLMLACFSCGESMVTFCTDEPPSCITRMANCWMRGAKVALNIMVCLRWAVSWFSSARSSEKPRSSMRSASSTTRNCTLSSLICIERCRSSKRPGVATTRSAFCSLAICNW
ncbi:hypothetical protein D3C71_1409980 [compost metagenome]